MQTIQKWRPTIWVVATIFCLHDAARAQDSTSTSNLAATFRTHAANPWRLEVAMESNASIVQVQGCVAEKCIPLQQKAVGVWAAGTPYPVIGPVVFVASDGTGESVSSQARSWPSGQLWDVANAAQGKPLPPPDPTMDGFAARFQQPSGGAWWVEVEIFANQNVRRVEAISDSPEQTTWLTKPLFATHKGTWSSSFHVPEGTRLHFRAQGSSGAWIESGTYMWPDAVWVESAPAENEVALGDVEDEDTIEAAHLPETDPNPTAEVEQVEEEIAAQVDVENEVEPPLDLRASLSSLTGKKSPAVSDKYTGLPLFPNFVIDKSAAIVLGKALFWDQQMGSDGISCASCHFHAGVDSRKKNQLSPGLNGGNGKFDVLASGGGGPNYTLRSSDFPIDTDDVASSSGTVAARFLDIREGHVDLEKRVASDQCEGLDAVDPFGFHVQGINLRRVAARNAPAAILATFNFHNFWDGRARREFNGQNPFGKRDKSAVIHQINGAGHVEEIPILLENMSASSQSSGPPLSPVEMSCAGRSYAHVGKKLLALMPLQLQIVSPTDGVLGPYVDASGKGLSVTYADLVAQAFHPRFWDTDAVLDEHGTTLRHGIPETTDEYDLMSINFAFLWGLAIHMYEDTLVPDQSPFDRYMDGEDSALSPEQLAGLEVFQGRGKCINCHKTATLSAASTLHLIDEHKEGGLVERMQPAGQKRMYGLRGEFESNSTGRKQKVRIDTEADVVALGTATPAGSASGKIFVEAAQSCHYDVTSWTLDPDQDSGSWSSSKDVEIKALLEPGEPSGCPDGVRVLWEVPPGSPNGRLRVYRDGVPYPQVDFSAPAKSYAWLTPVLYDNGFYNIGVRPIHEDIGVGGKDPFGHPLSHTRQYIDMLLGQDARDPFEVNECSFETPFVATVDRFFLPGGFVDVTCADGRVVSRPKKPSEISNWALRGAQKKAIQRLRTRVDGAFKTSMLRNIELTGPYFHNGGYLTLEQVVDFYDRGGDFSGGDGHGSGVDIEPLGLSSEEKSNLVAFMKALTDPRVEHEQAPFDHPELIIPHGHVDDTSSVTGSNGIGTDEYLELAATGAEGWPEGSPQCLKPFEEHLAP